MSKMTCKCDGCTQNRYMCPALKQNYQPGAKNLAGKPVKHEDREMFCQMLHKPLP